MTRAFTTSTEWKAVATGRGLTITDETGYTEDLNADCLAFAKTEEGEVLGYCFGGPHSPIDAVLFETANDCARYLHEGVGFRHDGMEGRTS